MLSPKAPYQPLKAPKYQPSVWHCTPTCPLLHARMQTVYTHPTLGEKHIRERALNVAVLAWLHTEIRDRRELGSEADTGSALKRWRQLEALIWRKWGQEKIGGGTSTL